MASNSTYGAVAVLAASNGAADEDTPLLGNRHSKSRPRWTRKLTDELRRDQADLVLILCYLITGLLDSASISTWGSFVSMQTGNTIYVALGIAEHHESNRWIKSTVSLLSFCLGSLCFSRFHRYFVPARRWVLCVSFLIQAALIAAAAAILSWGPASSVTTTEDSLDWSVLVPIALIAFQSCGQMMASRVLRHTALSSVVLTSNYCDLFADAELFVMSNPERNRKMSAPLLLLAGAVIGGVLARSAVGTAGALWVSAAMKLATVGVWFFWPAEDM